MLELHHVMKVQDFLSSSEFHIENESKNDEININVINRTKLNLLVYKSKVHQIEKFGIRPSLSIHI